MIFVCNAFSLQMVAGYNFNIKVERVTSLPGEQPNKVVSCIGHEDTAKLLGYTFNRQSIKLQKGDVLYVAQVVGGRLPEGCTTLPKGIEIIPLKVTIR